MAIVVAVAGASDIVTAGLSHILDQAPDLEILAEFPHFGIQPDVLLYDAVGINADDGVELGKLVSELDAAVLVVGRDLRPDLAMRALARGAVGYVSLEDPASILLSTIRDAALGRLDPEEHAPVALGVEANLTGQEVLILGDVVLGLSNQEIARQRSLSPNTVKSYIRSAYRKIGVTTRAQAVSWGLRHGFAPSRSTCARDTPEPGQRPQPASSATTPRSATNRR